MTIYWGTTSPFDHTLCSEQFSVLIVHPACSNLQYDGVFVFVVPQPVRPSHSRENDPVLESEDAEINLPVSHIHALSFE